MTLNFLRQKGAILGTLSLLTLLIGCQGAMQVSSKAENHCRTKYSTENDREACYDGVAHARRLIDKATCQANLSSCYQTARIYCGDNGETLDHYQRVCVDGIDIFVAIGKGEKMASNSSLNLFDRARLALRLGQSHLSDDHSAVASHSRGTNSATEYAFGDDQSGADSSSVTK